VQVCFGNMQHDLVLYRYTGWGADRPGEAGEGLAEGLPFSRWGPGARGAAGLPLLPRAGSPHRHARGLPTPTAARAQVLRAGVQVHAGARCGGALQGLLPGARGPRLGTRALACLFMQAGQQ